MIRYIELNNDDMPKGFALFDLVIDDFIALGYPSQRVFFNDESEFLDCLNESLEHFHYGVDWFDRLSSLVVRK